MPSRAMRCAGSAQQVVTVEARCCRSLGWYSRLTQLNSVVLPAPLGPISAQIWPSSIVNERSASATMPPNSTRTSSTVSNVNARPPWKGRNATACRLEAASSQAEQRVEADGEAGRLGDLPHREQHAGHERRPVVGVVADRRGSGRSCRAAPPGCATMPRIRTACTGIPSTSAATRALGDDLRGRVVGPVLRRGRDALRGARPRCPTARRSSGRGAAR